MVLLIVAMIFLNNSACKVGYSFTGASIPPNVKTVSVMYFPNYAPLVNATLSQVFTQKLKDKFTSQTHLSVIERNGDLQFEGQITDYTNQPTAIQQNQTAAQNRLTITVKVKYTNTVDEKMSFESTFTKYADYPSSQAFGAVEGELIKTISDQIVQDIFNKAVVNW